jgi:hypothetical protein
MRHSRLHRTLTLVFALLHLLVPPLVGAADARLQREALDGPRVVMHAESEGAPHCPRTHPLDCGLCLALAPFALPARAEHTLPAGREALAARGELLVGDRAPGRFAPALPRAPPAS